MKVTGVLSDLFSSVFGFFNPPNPNQKPKELNPVRQSEDRYTSTEIRDLYEASFGPSPRVQVSLETPFSGVKYSPFGVLVVAGCGGDGSSNPPYNYGGTGGKDGGVSKDAGVDSGKDGGSPVPDAGVGKDAGSTAPVDKDGDGFKSDVDCDDNDPNTFPLKDDQTLNIKASTTICPGTYKRVRINLTGVDGLTVKGTGVILDADGANQKDAGYITGIVQFNNVHHTDFSGFGLHPISWRVFQGVA